MNYKDTTSLKLHGPLAENTDSDNSSRPWSMKALSTKWQKKGRRKRSHLSFDFDSDLVHVERADQRLREGQKFVSVPEKNWLEREERRWPAKICKLISHQSGSVRIPNPLLL